MRQEYDFTKAEDIIRFQSDHYDQAYGDYVAYHDYLHTIPDKITLTETKKFLKLKTKFDILTRIINNAIMATESADKC
jgi:hypothetical protein